MWYIIILDLKKIDFWFYGSVETTFISSVKVLQLHL